MKQLIEINNLVVSYGYSPVLKGVSLEVKAGEVVTILGANGAGKTTLLRTISGLLHPLSGEILFEGQKIDQMPPEKIVRLGIVQSPEGRGIFPGLTVYENLLVPAAMWSKKESDMKELLDKIYTLFPRLAGKKNQLGWSLSGGEQQMLAIGRAMMGRPKVMLLDEPSLGLAPNLVDDLFEKIKEINREGVTMILVEQNAYMALEVATRGYVLETGSIRLSGSAAELMNNPEIEQAYLGS
jgi:branched-chain amino acid transport system ATP-binding protein